MSDVTVVLNALGRGDQQAASVLLQQVYDELRLLAAQKMSHESPDLTLQPTALVHEAYLRLLGPANAAGFANRRHFFAAASEAMRRILIERARLQKHPRVALELNDLALKTTPGMETLLSVHEVLDQLENHDPEIAQLVKLRFFSGLSMPEAAEVLGQTLRTTERWWTYARTWLHTRLKESELLK